MGLFSKLNFPAAERAQKDATALRFVAEVAEECVRNASDARSTIDLERTCSTVATVMADAIPLLTSSEASCAVALRCLEQVTSSIPRQLIVRFGPEARVGEVLEYLDAASQDIGERCLIAVERGYVSVSMAGAQSMVERYRGQISDAIRSLPAEQPERDRAPPRSSASPPPRPSHCERTCEGCGQRMRLPAGVEIRYQCPNCGRRGQGVFH